MLHSPRSIDYQILRTCERLRLPESEFSALNYAEQVRLLAYGMLRDREEAAWLQPF
jgi:hypothetical protein